MLNAIQRFFAYHMIETYGCDYSTSGLSFDTLHSKLKAFLELRTVDGPRHDTYVLYYSGHTHGTGEWALAGKSTSGSVTVVEDAPVCETLLFILKQCFEILNFPLYSLPSRHVTVLFTFSLAYLFSIILVISKGFKNYILC